MIFSAIFFKLINKASNTRPEKAASAPASSFVENSLILKNLSSLLNSLVKKISEFRDPNPELSRPRAESRTRHDILKTLPDFDTHLNLKRFFFHV